MVKVRYIGTLHQMRLIGTFRSFGSSVTVEAIEEKTEELIKLVSSITSKLCKCHRLAESLTGKHKS
jgi:hypothetical protein